MLFGAGLVGLLIKSQLVFQLNFMKCVGQVNTSAINRQFKLNWFVPIPYGDALTNAAGSRKNAWVHTMKFVGGAPGPQMVTGAANHPFDWGGSWWNYAELPIYITLSLPVLWLWCLIEKRPLTWDGYDARHDVVTIDGERYLKSVMPCSNDQARADFHEALVNAKKHRLTFERRKYSEG